MKDNLGSIINRAKSRERKAYCAQHPVSYWGRMTDGNFFERCTQGFKKNEECERRIVK